MSVDTRPVNQTETDKAQPEWAATSHRKDSHMHVPGGVLSLTVGVFVRRPNPQIRSQNKAIPSKTPPTPPSFARYSLFCILLYAGQS
jgi:hypothetical protein